MSIDAEPIAVTLRVVAELERLGIDYLVGGSIASSVHGRPRTTDDVDLDLRRRDVMKNVRSFMRAFQLPGGGIGR